MRASFTETAYRFFLSEKAKTAVERFILSVAIVSFLIHLFLIYASKYGWIKFAGGQALLASPIASIYTPFSFILIYEVYLLIFFLPKSMTTYIEKQYEIISLIVIRRLFKDLPEIEFTPNWFDVKIDLQFVYDLLTSLSLFFLIYLFALEQKKLQLRKPEERAHAEHTHLYIRVKKIIASLLVPVLASLAIFAFFSWIQHEYFTPGSVPLKDINNYFFDEFFSFLIIVDVFLLLFSLFYTHEFHKVIRNSGFIVSTILIRLSFSAEGLLNNLLIIGSICFGLAILWIHNKFERNLTSAA